MNTKTIVGVIIAILVVIGLIVWLPKTSPQRQSQNQPPAPSDTTGSINQQLQNVDIGTPDFNGIDKDLQSL